MEEGGRHYVGQKTEKQLKGKFLKACVVPACIYGLGTLGLTERQEETDSRKQLGPKNMQSNPRR